MGESGANALEPVELVVPVALFRQPHSPETEGGDLAAARCGLGDAGGPELTQDCPADGFADCAATPLDPRAPEEIPSHSRVGESTKG